MAKIIGITGGIGSGKSTLIEFVNKLGYKVYVSDEESKKIINSEEIIKKTQFLFPDHVLVVEGFLDKKKLAEIVFSDPDKLKKLNNLIHPLVKIDFENWVKKNEKEQLLFKESAILFESGGYKECDLNILITAPVEIRIERVVRRDQVTKEKVLERINNQWSDEKKTLLADYIVENVDLALSTKEIVNIINKISK